MHKQRTEPKKRPPPRERTQTETTTKIAVEVHPAKKPCTDHNYPASSITIEKKLVVTRQQLQDARKKLKVVKQKVKRKDIRIAHLLQQVKDQNLINQGQLDLLKLNFGENTLTLIENEIKASECDKHGHRYSEDLKQFAVTLHFYSPQAYEFLRQYLHLPHPSTIRKWSASLDCQPGFLMDVIDHLKQMAESDPFMKHCSLMLDAMALKKEVVYDKKNGTYAGFVDCGNFLPTSEDSLATEALVFMAVGLTNRWKFPVAYFLTDHLSGAVQAEIVKQLICVLTEAGMVVHGVVCDGSYANQSMATLLGCSMIPGKTKSYFPHPLDPSKNVNFIFDACHLVKLVRNCLATLGTIYHNGEQISWSFIDKLYKFQQKDNLHLANKLRTKHVQWKRHKMNVKVAVQALSSSVADAIDFLREDLQIPEFAGSAKTTEFIRIVDKLFDFMNSRTPKGKGYKQPMNIYNLALRETWLQDTKKYIESLKDASGQALVLGRRKTAWIGFITTIDSVLEICHDVLFSADRPFKYVCTYKLSQDHLEMLFSRVRRRGGWNNNPNCLQFKWALRAILLKNRIVPSKNANVTIEEPLNRLFGHKIPAKVKHTNEKMQEFAQLLREPSIYHDNVLHYMAGYITRHVLNDCRCTQCCMALHQNATHEPEGPMPASLTLRKDRGGLVKPREDAYKIIKTADTIFRFEIDLFVIQFHFFKYKLVQF